MRKPPLTPAEHAYFLAEFRRYDRGQGGINADQESLLHYSDSPACGCHFCSGAPILMTPYIPLWPHTYPRIA